MSVIGKAIFAGTGTGGYTLVPVPSVTVGTYTYNGSAQGPTIGTYDSSQVVVSNATKTDAGTYTLTLSLRSTKSMLWADATTADKTYEYTIDKADLSGITASVSTYTYGGTKGTPSISSNPSGGAVTYYAKASSDGAATLWDSVTATTYDAGTRYVYAVIGETKNYNSFTTPAATFTISKADFTSAVSISGYNYAGSKSSPSVTNNPGNGAVTYYGRATASGQATAWTSVTSTTYDAGTRYCYAVIAETTNYNSYTTDNASFVIGKGTYSSSVTISGYTYAGTKSTPSVSNNPESGAVTYYGRATSGGTATAWSSVTSSTYDAGTRYIYAVIAETTNYNSVTTGETSFTISKATFSSTVSIAGYTYAGTKSTPSVSNNPGNGTVTYYGRATASGSATAWSNVTSTTYDAGTRYCYAVIAETTNYSSVTTGNASFAITKADFNSTVTISNYTYAGTKSTPSVTNNPGNASVTYYARETATGTATAWSSVTSTTYDSGTRYIYAEIAASTNYNSCTTDNTSFTISKASGSVSTAPSFSQKTYTGSAQAVATAGSGTGTMKYYLSTSSSTPASSSYSTSLPTLTDATSSTYYLWYYADASTNYNASTPTYKTWSGSSSNMLMKKATPTITKSDDSVSLSTATMNKDVTITRTGNGTLTVTSSDTGVATVANTSGSTYRISAVANGSCTINISVASSSNYEAATASISVNCALVSNTLNDNTWSTISAISAAGTGSTYWNVGDRKKITLNGTVGTLSLSNVETYVYILGFDHNASVEGSGITFGGFKTALTGGTDVCLIDGSYNSYKTDGTKLFNMNHWGGYNYGGWAACDMRYDILGSTNQAPASYGSARTTSSTGNNPTSTCATSPVANTLMATLPSDLRAVMKPITKYTDNKGNSSNTSANVTTTVDYLPLLAEKEVFGTRTYANQYEGNNQVQYTYYANNNSKVKYRHSATSSAAIWWLRSPNYYNASDFCLVNTSGYAYANYAYTSFGLAPLFII